jgi:hypothetical protein
MPELYLAPDELKKMSVKEKFDWAAKVNDLETAQIKLILVGWQSFFRDKLLVGEDCLEILNQISRAMGLLETNISVKLLLENLLLKI